MNFETKVYLIIILLIIDLLASLLDVVEELYFYPLSKNFTSEEKKEHDKNMLISKLFLDIPFTLLSIYLLMNINFSALVYLFIFLNYLGSFQDYYIDRQNLDENKYYFLKHNLPLVIDAFSFIIGIFVLYNIFYVEK